MITRVALGGPFFIVVQVMTNERGWANFKARALYTRSTGSSFAVSFPYPPA